LHMQCVVEKNVKKAAQSTALCVFVFLLFHAAMAQDAAQGALQLCVSVIVPSLFPFMVISSLMVRCGALSFLGRPLAPITKRLLRLPGCAAGAVILGALCGFPVGAKTACELYENRFLTKRQTERLIAIANNTGPAFIAEVIGAHFWGSRGLGIAVYLLQILTALLIGAVYARLSPAPAGGKADTDTRPLRRAPEDLLHGLSASVSCAAQSSLTVCGFIVFFAVILELCGHALASVGLGALVPYAAALTEFSSGAAASAAVGGTAGAFLCGFTVGWSGLSVFAQCRSFTAEHGISLRPAALCKCIQGILCGIGTAVYFRLFADGGIGGYTGVFGVGDGPAPYPAAGMPVHQAMVYGELLGLILFCLMPFFTEKLYRKKS